MIVNLMLVIRISYQMNTIIVVIILLVKMPIDADYSALSEEIKMDPKASKFKLGERWRNMKHKNSFNKGYIKNWSRETFVIDAVLKTNRWTYRIKDSKREKQRAFRKKKCC